MKSRRILSLWGAHLREWLAGAKIETLLLRSAPYGAHKMQKQGSDFRKIRRLCLISLPASPPKTEALCPPYLRRLAP